MDIVNVMLHSLCVEWNCHYFFLFHLSYSCLFLFCLLVLPYYMVNEDEYIHCLKKNIHDVFNYNSRKH